MTTETGRPIRADGEFAAGTIASIADNTVGAEFASLLEMVRRTIRLVVSHWPAMIAWILFGFLGQYVVVQFAGWVAASHLMAGLALMPIAILFRLIALVAMLLVVRDGMPHLSSIAPIPASKRERQREFVDAVLAGVLPFFAFYVAWTFLLDDMTDFYIRQTAVQYSRLQSPNDDSVNATALTLTWFTGTVVVITFVARRILGRFTKASSRLVPLVAVYVEALWVFLSILIIGDLTDRLSEWVSTRQAVVWLSDIGDWISRSAAPLDWLLEFVGWIFSEVTGLVLFPLAWLTIAGVVYGQAIEPGLATSRVVAGRAAVQRRLNRVRDRVGSAPGWLRQRLRDIWDGVVERLRPIGEAILLMWRVGPVLIAGFVLFYRGYEWFDGTLKMVIAHLFGPHPLSFWNLYYQGIFVIAPVLAAPVGIAIVAATVDMVLGKTRPTDENSLIEVPFDPPRADSRVLFGTPPMPGVGSPTT